MVRGKFITFYGINNIGKTTHAKRLCKRLVDRGIRAKFVKFPIYTIEPTGVFLNKILRSGTPQTISEEELQMWFALNRFQFEPKLRELLESGAWVVAEDYCGTGIGWGTTKGADRKWLEAINQPLFREDFSIFLTGQRSYLAKEADHIHEQNDSLMHRAHEVFKTLASDFGWHTVELEKTKSQTGEKIWGLVEKELL